MNNFSWAADLVNPQPSSSVLSSTGINKANDEELNRIINSYVSNEGAGLTTNENNASSVSLYKLIEQYLQAREPDGASNGKDVTGCKDNVLPEDQTNDEMKNAPADIEESKTTKRNVASSTEQPAKFYRIGDEGKIVSGYYTPIAEEKLHGFQSTYINIGSPRCVKEVVGIRKNTQFVTPGKKKTGNDNPAPTYLVVSFENRKKSNSPFIEYPLSKLGVIIKALQDLRDRMIHQWYYAEPKIIKCEYPENTIITDKNCRDTILTTLD